MPLKKYLYILRNVHLMERFQIIKLGVLKRVIELLENNLSTIPDYVFEVKDVLNFLYAYQSRIKMDSSAYELEVKGIPSFDYLNLYLRKKSSDFAVFKEVFAEQYYGELISIIAENGDLDKIKVIMDVGANIGCSAIYFSKVFTHSQIVAIEPDEGNFSILEKNVVRNSCANVQLLKAGIWYKNTNLVLTNSFRDSRSWSLSLKEPDSELGNIRAYDIVSLLEKYHFEHIDILKIDIEGGEKHIFESIERVKPFINKVRYLSIEIHEEIYNKTDFTQLMSECNFRIFDVGSLLIAKNCVFSTNKVLKDE